jgi:hypothetical protein
MNNPSNTFSTVNFNLFVLYRTARFNYCANYCVSGSMNIIHFDNLFWADIELRTSKYHPSNFLILEIRPIYSSPKFIYFWLSIALEYVQVFVTILVLVRAIEITIYNNAALRSRVFVRVHQNKTVIAEYVNLGSIKMKS